MNGSCPLISITGWECLAAAWKDLGPDYLSFGEVEQCILDADRMLSGGQYQRHILEVFDWREIWPPETGQFRNKRNLEHSGPSRLGSSQSPRRHSIRRHGMG